MGLTTEFTEGDGSVFGVKMYVHSLPLTIVTSILVVANSHTPQQKWPYRDDDAAVVDVDVVSCTFPVEWRGLWYESRSGPVSITATDFAGRGTCIDHFRDYYLVENRDIGCQSCLLIRQRHLNIVQYQESFCVGKDTLKTTCSSIQNETIQHTLIRGNAHPITCPFRDAFHFSYNNNSGGFCRNPPSYIRPCASSGQLRFHFRQCSDAAYTYDTDVDVECVATWRNEEHLSFLIGRLVTSRDRKSKQDKYRCITYNVLGTVVYAAMSADASCRGLVTPRDGPVVMEFTQDVFGWPKTQCPFPTWVLRSSWRDLGGQHIYKPYVDGTTDGTAIQVWFRQSPADGSTGDRVVKVIRCQTLVSRNTTERHLTSVSFISYGCLTKYQCIKFVRHRGAIEVHEGRYTDHALEPCLEQDMLKSNRRILFPDITSGRPCPLRGLYAIQTANDHCPTFLDVGCNRSNTISLVNRCDQTASGLRLECLRSWKKDRIHYVIAKKADNHSMFGVANCFTMHRSGSTLKLAVDPSCNSGTSTVLLPGTITAQLIPVNEHRQADSGYCDDVTSLLTRDSGKFLIDSYSARSSLSSVDVPHQTTTIGRRSRPKSSTSFSRKYSDGGPYRYIDDRPLQPTRRGGSRHKTSPLSNKSSATLLRRPLPSPGHVIGDVIRSISVALTVRLLL